MDETTEQMAMAFRPRARYPLRVPCSPNMDYRYLHCPSSCVQQMPDFFRSSFRFRCRNSRRYKYFPGCLGRRAYPRVTIIVALSASARSEVVSGLAASPRHCLPTRSPNTCEQPNPKPRPTPPTWAMAALVGRLSVPVDVFLLEPVKLFVSTLCRQHGISQASHEETQATSKTFSQSILCQPYHLGRHPATRCNPCRPPR
jgi:hypothetical protein